MPIIVDHDERRQQIATVVKRMVAEAGMEAVTFRNVAREAGFSSTIVSHYFRDKRELLSVTYSSIRTYAIETIEDAFKARADLFTCFEKLLPVNTHNLADWQAWFGFWGKATSDAGLAADRVAAVEGTQKLFIRILQHAVDDGELPDGLDLDLHAYRLQMFINGLSSFVVMDPKAWPPRRQRAMLAAEIELLKSFEAASPRAPAEKKPRRAART
jgi:AcrR family transcriptional regulator